MPYWCQSVKQQILYFYKLLIYIRKAHKNFQINCMIHLFIKNHKPLPCKHLNQHKLIYTAIIVLHILTRNKTQFYILLD